MFKKLVLAFCMILLGAAFAVAQERTLVVAHDTTWPPMEYIDSNKQIVGYSVDYIDAVAKEVGVKIDHRTVAWDGIFAGLLSGRYDLISSSVTITPERKEEMDFSEPYAIIKQAVLVSQKNNPVTTDDLEGKTIGAQLGTTGFFAIGKIKDAKSKPYDEIGMAVEALYSGRLDAVICDYPVANDFILKKGDYKKKLKVAFIIPANNEYYGFAVKKGNKELVELLNKGIEQVKAKGIEKELQMKWFGAALE